MNKYNYQNVCNAFLKNKKKVYIAVDCSLNLNYSISTAFKMSKHVTCLIFTNLYKLEGKPVI